MTETLTLFLCGDVMTGRGIDQILPHSVDSRLYEPLVRDARQYVELAEAASGEIDAPVDFDYIWGDALDELRAVDPDARLINLETAVTRHDKPWPGKQIHYRMHPDNVSCLTVAEIDGCGLANNHILDWGPQGLEETLATLHRAGIATAGAGRRLEQAQAPAIIELGSAPPPAQTDPAVEDGELEDEGPRGARILLFAYGSETAGVPREWEATLTEPGVSFLPDLADATVEAIAERVWSAKTDGDVVVVSLHWGPNWGYYIPPEHRSFAQRLIDEAGVDIVWGHSSHHAKGLEIYRDKLILYGCGDLLNDYEGIGGYERFRSNLTLMVFPEIDARSGELVSLRLVPMQVERMRLRRPSAEDVRWLQAMLNRESQPDGVRFDRRPDRSLVARW